MPLKSKSQAGYMFIHHPEIAKEWAAKTASMASLPEHVEKKKKIKPKLA
jgi:hypothetical protein